MPSEERVEVAFTALSQPIEKYRSAVVATTEEVRGLLAAQPRESPGGAQKTAAGLGVFAAGRIDMERFARLLPDSQDKEDPDALRRVAKALEILRAISSEGKNTFYLKMRSGSRLRDAVAARLAEIGRGFAAARLAGLVARGVLPNGHGEELLGPLEFEAWSTAERQLAPPLVIELEGADLQAVELAGFLDGSVKVLLLVNGEAPPAPLVRLITPNTFVLQTSDPADLDRFAGAAPPAVAAWMPTGTARFVHDPLAGDLLSDRLQLLELPEKPPRKKLGGLSALQQREELDQLRALGSAAAATPTVGPATADKQMTSVDKLAAWLLAQTDLSDLEATK